MTRLSPFGSVRGIVMRHWAALIGIDILGFVACLGMALSSIAHADWPELLGPSRNGYAVEGTQLAAAMPSEKKALWELPAGQGYAGAAIRDGKVALFQRDGNEDVLRLVALDSGKILWKASFPATYRQGIDEDKGPRSVPVFAGDAIVLHSAAGAVHCVAVADGKVRWSRPLRKEYGADDGYFGAGNTPLVVGGHVIVNVGAKKQKAGVVAVALADGKNVWQATDADAGYASPILLKRTDSSEASGTVVVPTRLVTYGMEAKTGKVLWEYPFGQRGPTVNAATPILLPDGTILQTSSYGIGFVCARAGSSSVEIASQGDEISSQYATPVSVGQYVYASDGREDMGSGYYKCVDPKTGKALWSEIGMPVCHTIVSPDPEQPKLLLTGIDGRIWYLPAKPDKFRPIWQTRLPFGKYRALPALSGNLLVVRTSLSPDAKWMCIEL